MEKSSRERSKHGDSSEYPKRQRMDCQSPVNVKEEISNEEEEIRRDNISAGNKDSPDAVGHCGNKSDSVIPNESKPLLCPACSGLLKIPVYQCDNGHIACSSCSIFWFSGSFNKCHTCTAYMGKNRNEAIEKLVEHVKVECKNAEYGCKETFFYSQKEEHEKVCEYTICYCPGDDCSFDAPAKELFEHFECHLNDDSLVHFQYNKAAHITLDVVYDGSHVLREEKDGLLFVLDISTAQDLKFFSISCTESPSKSKFSYDILARSAKSTLRFQSSTKNTADYEDFSLNDCLVLPSDFITSIGDPDYGKFQQLVELDVWIWHPGVSPAQIRIV